MRLRTALRHARGSVSNGSGEWLSLDGVAGCARPMFTGAKATALTDEFDERSLLNKGDLLAEQGDVAGAARSSVECVHHARRLFTSAI
jgi:hypothetical protein